MRLTYLPHGAQETGGQTSGVLLLLSGLRANSASRTPEHLFFPRKGKTDGGGLHLLHQARAMPKIVDKLLINKGKTVQTSV